MLKQALSCKKVFKKHLAGREQGCAKMFLVFDGKRPSKTDGRFMVSTPPHTQVKNVTMSEQRKRADRPPPGFKKAASRVTRDQNTINYLTNK